jgi:uncharacterized protein YcbK (DUF882 family)
MTKATILTRRRFMKETMRLAAGIVIASPFDGFAVTANSKHPMTFYHTHTGERLHIDYSCNGCSQSTQIKLNSFLRDFRTGEVQPIDTGLLDIIYGIQQNSGCEGVIEIISGYRSQKTNKQLRSKSSGVASKSLHMKGQALDMRLSGLNSKKLRDVAISLQKGGVGYYAKSNFVHIDTGRVRTW